MVRPFWPTVQIETLRPDGGQDSGTGDGPVHSTPGPWDDWVNSWSPNDLPVEDGVDRTEVWLTITIDPLVASEWYAVLPDVPGLEFWTAPEGGTRLTVVHGASDLIYDEIPGNGIYKRQVWVSVDPAYTGTPLGIEDIAFHAEIPSDTVGIPYEADVQDMV